MVYPARNSLVENTILSWLQKRLKTKNENATENATDELSFLMIVDVIKNNELSYTIRSLGAQVLFRQHSEESLKQHIERTNQDCDWLEVVKFCIGIHSDVAKIRQLLNQHELTVLATLDGFIVSHNFSSIESQLPLILQVLLLFGISDIGHNDPMHLISTISRGLAKMKKYVLSHGSNFDFVPFIPLLNSTVDLVHLFWESRFHSVVDCVLSLYGDCLEIMQAIQYLPIDLFRHYVREFPWYSRGKWKVMLIQLEKLSNIQIDKSLEVDLLRDIESCFESQPLSRSAASLLLALCERLDPHTVTSFCEKCLLDKSELVRQSFVRNFVPPITKDHASLTLSLTEGVLAIFESRTNNLWETVVSHANQLSCVANKSYWDNDTGWEWSERERALWAWIVLVKFQLQLCGKKPVVQKNILSQALLYPLHEIRSEAFSVLLLSKSNPADQQLLYEIIAFFRQNMAVDNAVFRDQVRKSFQGYLQKLLKLLSTMKQPELESVKSTLVDFLLFIGKLCLGQFFPGSNFQRNITAFSVLETILDTSNACYAEIYVVLKSHLINLPEAVEVLVHKLQHSTPDIHSHAANILLHHCEVKDDLLLPLFQRAYSSCHSPKELECQMGANLFRFLIKIEYGSSC